MANNFWIKLYHEMLDDPKVGRLDDRTYRTMINLFLLAGEVDSDGKLPNFGDMAWRLRKPENELLADLEALQAVNIVTQEEDGSWFVRKFSHRQQRISNAKKQKAYRDRKRLEEAAGYGFELDENEEGTENITEGNKERDADITNGHGGCYGGVTNGNADIEEDPDRDTDEDRDKEMNSSSSASPPPVDNLTPAVIRPLVKKISDLTGMDLSGLRPKPDMVHLLTTMHNRGVIPDDIQAAWDWYEGLHGRPSKLEVLKKPIMQAMRKRTQENKQPERSSEFDAFVQT